MILLYTLTQLGNDFRKHRVNVKWFMSKRSHRWEIELGMSCFYLFILALSDTTDLLNKATRLFLSRLATPKSSKLFYSFDFNSRKSRNWTQLIYGNSQLSTVDNYLQVSVSCLIALRFFSIKKKLDENPSRTVYFLVRISEKIINQIWIKFKFW